MAPPEWWLLTGAQTHNAIIISQKCHEKATAGSSAPAQADTLLLRISSQDTTVDWRIENGKSTSKQTQNSLPSRLQNKGRNPQETGGKMAGNSAGKFGSRLPRCPFSSPRKIWRRRPLWSSLLWMVPIQPGQIFSRRIWFFVLLVRDWLLFVWSQVVWL